MAICLRRLKSIVNAFASFSWTLEYEEIGMSQMHFLISDCLQATSICRVPKHYTCYSTHPAI